MGQMLERRGSGLRKASGDAGRGYQSRRKKKVVFIQRLFCCCCLQRSENISCLKENGGDGESVQIVVEDLGVENPSFTFPEADERIQRGTMGRSASSVSCQRATQKKKLAPLSSMPLQFRTTRGSLNSEEYDSAAESLLFSDGGLLTPPVINLIPPTPSDVIDDDQFFDINSEEESTAHTSGSEGLDSTGSVAPEEHEEEEEEEEEKEKERKEADHCDVAEVSTKTESPEIELKDEAKKVQKEKLKQNKMSFLRSCYQVPPLPEYPRKRSFNTGINLLQFTEHNLDDINNKDTSRHDLLKAQLSLLPFSNNMDSQCHQKKPAARSCSLGDRMPRSHTFHSIHHSVEDISEDEGSPRQRRITVASYIPQSKDQNGNFAAHDSNRHRAKTLAELNTEEVCQWFTSIGLEKCLPFIREAELSGSHIACIDLNTLDVLQVSGLEERETLLSAIYRELHPPNTTTQKLDSLLETFGPNNIERFTAALVSMSKSKSSPHINSNSMNQSLQKFRNKGQHFGVHRNTHLMEITINASERIVHLRTPRDTNVGKVLESCLRMLGISEDKDHFSLKNKEGSSEDFSTNQQIGNLPGSEDRQLELKLCKKENLGNSSESSETNELNTHEDTTQHISQGKEGKIQELNQQVDSLQNVILQVQDLHHGLVAFCSELKKMDGQLDTELLDSVELKRRLTQAQEQLQEKRHNLQTLKDSLSISPVQTNKRAEVWLLEKMKVNCQVFKEETALVHLNRYTAHLHAALEEALAKERTAKKDSTLAQLVSPQCPAMLVATEERAGSDGGYGFTAGWVDGHGLQVIQAGNSSLCINDRLVEVNGVSVLGSSEEELAVLLQRPVSHLVVLRKPGLQLCLDHPNNLPPKHTTVRSGCQDELAAQ